MVYRAMIRTTLRQWLAVAILLGSSALMPSIVHGQSGYPSRPITLIVPFAAGGSTDVIGRIVAEGLRQELGQSVIVDNRGGAGGTIGTAAIAHAAPDGYTIGMATASTVTINPAVYKNLNYDVLTDLVFISNIAAVPNIMSVHPGVPATNMKELIALAKARPGQVSYGSSGHGSVSHLLGEQFKMATQTDLVHVPYRGMGPALNDAIGGQVQVVFDNLPTSLALVQAGKLRALAVSGEQRVRSLPNVPTFAELGYPEVSWMAFFGLVAPKGTPMTAVNRLYDAIRKLLAKPEIRQRLEAQQALIVGSTPDSFKGEVERELTRKRHAVTAAKIQLN